MIRHALLVVLVLAGCRDATGKQTPTTDLGSGSAIGSATTSGSGSGSAVKEAESANDYVPDEFKQGMSRWKDTGVYLDGKPIGFIQFGELPIGLPVTWVKDKVSDNKPPGCPVEKCPGWKWSEARYYKFTDYLKAVGVDIHKIKMVHVYGPKLSQTIAVSGHDLESKAADEFMFRFGGLVAGKAIPHVPPNFGNHKAPDKMSSMMIYIDKKPPTITRDGIELDGVDQTGVPYYGEPLRGGVRIYLDDRLITIIKRQELDVKKGVKGPEGDVRWSLSEFLKSKNVDTSKVVEAWVIRDERRKEMFAWPDLEKMSFSASNRARGGVLLGDKEVRASALALHTRHIRTEELPVIRDDEE